MLCTVRDNKWAPHTWNLIGLREAGICPIKVGQLQENPGILSYLPCSISAADVVLVTGYSVTSDVLSDGTCTTISGSPVYLQSPYSAIHTASVPESEFTSSLVSDFVSFLGFDACLGGGSNITGPVTPLEMINGTLYPLTSSPHRAFVATSISASSYGTTSSGTQGPPAATSRSLSQPPKESTLDVGQRTGIGVGVSLVLVILLVLGWLFSRRHDRQKSRKRDAQVSRQPYLQSKAELDDEDNRTNRYELEVQEVPTPELEPKENSIQEIEGPWSITELGDKHPLKRRQELQGQDGSNEMDAQEQGQKMVHW